VPILFVVVAVWLVVSSIKAYPVESAVGVFLISLGLPFYLYFQIMRDRAVGADS
jgi:uncharacterized membrane protein